MEKLTFNLGETPEATIRERLADDAEYSSEFFLDERDFEGPAPDYEPLSARMLVGHLSPDDLLTLLEALRMKGLAQGLEFGNHKKQAPAMKLRIQILGALGIEER